MDDWLKQLQEHIHTAARESSDQFAKVSEQTNKAVEEFVEPVVAQWVEDSIEAIEQVEKAIEPVLEEINDQVDSTLNTGFIFFEQQVAPWIEETTAPITHTVNPWLQNHPACIGCQNYHGIAYGEKMLVCGMHPYGPDDKTCADWESVWASHEDSSSD
ncbi:MAG: hypothetical protein AAGC93_01020 [Cyanobacteria bacterium P01_F01_bin.53]